MRITSGYRVEILKLHRPLARTMKVCREAVSWLYPVMEREWEALSGIQWEKKRFNTAEKLIHATARNRAKYGFDAAFPKMPSYLRRAVLQHVLGVVYSGKTRAVEGRPARNHYMPVFYKDNMYRKEGDRVFLKLYNGKDWVWQGVRLKRTNLDYIRTGRERRHRQSCRWIPSLW